MPCLRSFDAGIGSLTSGVSAHREGVSLGLCICARASAGLVPAERTILHYGRSQPWKRLHRACLGGAPICSGCQPSAQSSIHWDEPSGEKEYRSWRCVVQNHVSTETSSVRAEHKLKATRSRIRKNSDQTQTFMPIVRSLGDFGYRRQPTYKSPGYQVILTAVEYWSDGVMRMRICHHSIAP